MLEANNRFVFGEHLAFILAWEGTNKLSPISEEFLTKSFCLHIIFPHELPKV